jgi:hypothetical protein
MKGIDLSRAKERACERQRLEEKLFLTLICTVWGL